MFSRFFIERPIFASVLSIVITLAGAVAVFTLPIAQYPQITPPSIIVQCNYPGASARVVAESVAAPIEQQVNGVEGMMYMSSQSGNDGSYSLTVTFKPGMNLNFAQVLVQNRVNLALPLLPDVVRQTGLTTRKRNPDILLIVSLYSPRGRYNQLYLSNYATIRIKDELARVDGVGDVFNFGLMDYSMRVWLDPDRLASYGLAANDVANALREQNQQIATGQIGQPPSQRGLPFQLTITTLGRLDSPEQFESIVLKTAPNGARVLLKDVGRVVMGARSLDVTSRLDGMSCTSLAVFQLPYANAIETANLVRAKMADLKKSFPEDVEYAIAYDTTPFISESIREVFRTLVEAVVLVGIVVLVFLQNWRSTLIPLAAVPVAIVGTFAVMAAIGFSLNNLTLFGLVLAIGIVVDDAIVVVEAVEHHIEEGLSPRRAAHQAMREVSGPVIAVALVLSAVFVPCAFISGITGMFFRQFALTIAVSTVISAFNSLTLSPALAAILLQKRGAKKDIVDRAFGLLLGWFFRGFNWAFTRTTNTYVRAVELALRGSAVVLLLYGGFLLLTWWGFMRLPTGYIPNQDQGKLYVAIQLPDSASHERTEAVTDRASDIVRHTRGVAHVISTAGQSFTLQANGSNFGNLFISLDDFSERHDPGLHSDAITAELRRKLNAAIPEAIVTVLGPPPVAGLGNSGGFKFIVEDRGENTLEELQAQTDHLIAASKGELPDVATTPDPRLAGLFTVFRANSPQLYVDLDRDQCRSLGIDPLDVFSSLQIYLGSRYVNDVNKFGRTWQVIVQAHGESRDDLDRVSQLRVRNSRGEMVPLGSFLSVRPISGPILLTRYNMYPAAAVVGNTRPGVSTGQGIEAMQQLAAKVLPPSMGYEWTEINFIQIDSSKNVWNNLIFPLAVVFVFLVLAAQYESWSLPLAVILVVPMCLLGSIAGVAVAAGDVNIFTQIGFVVLVGLASKNAILIVEFAKHRHEEGHLSRHDATLAACRLRLRPILMTSFAFILGVLPLLVSRGAGAEMRWALGTAVFSGMLAVTLFGIFLTPVFFYVIEWFVESPLFSSERARQLGVALRLALDIATLALFRLPGLLDRLQRRTVPVGRSPEPTRPINGHRAPRADVHWPPTPGHGVTIRPNGASKPNASADGDGAPVEDDPDRLTHK